MNIEEIFERATGNPFPAHVSSIHHDDLVAFATLIIEECQKPVRIYDYVWPQQPEHEDECVYSCNYSPALHLAKGELLVVVHPDQLVHSFLLRENGL
jgi:hypothetical protein